MKVICIDEKNRPNEIPLSHWVKEGEEYTVIEVKKLNVQNGIYGCKIEEINIDMFIPLEYFRLDRFRPLDILKVYDLHELEAQ